MSIYDNNLAAIKQYNNSLYNSIIQDKPVSDHLDCNVEPAKDGNSIIYVNKDNERIYLNSRYNPQKEADSFVKKFQGVKDYSLIVFFGIGNGMAAGKLIKIMPEHVTFLFYEPSASIFLSTISYFDLSEIFQCDRVSVVVNGISTERVDIALARSVTLTNYRMCNYVVMPMYKRLFNEEEKDFSQRYEFHIASQIGNIHTVRRFGKKLAYNNIYNLRKLFNCNCEEDFEKVLPVDKPVIIVSAGPSLEKNVDYLKEAKGYFFIIAVDSALPFLMDRGIRPDVVFIVDAAKPKKMFDDERFRNIVLAASTEANYEALECIDNKTIFISSENSYYDKIFQISGRRLYELSGGGSVATFAFAQAIAWGYRTIVFVGQDLAIKANKLHAGNVDDKLGSFSNRDDEILEVEGYYGDIVYTYRDYDYFRRWFEVVIEGDRSIEVINATEGGARIKGTTQMSLKEVIEKYKDEPFDYEKVISEYPPTFSCDQYGEIIKIWVNSKNNLIEIKKLLFNGIEGTQSGLEMVKNGDIDKSKLNDIKSDLSYIIEHCDQMDEIYFLDAMVASEEADVLGDIYFTEDDSAEEICRIFEKLQRYMKLMYSNVDEVVSMFEDVIKYTDDYIISHI